MSTVVTGAAEPVVPIAMLPMFSGNVDEKTVRMRVVIAKAGGVAIPKSARQRLRLKPGDILESGLEGRSIILRPAKDSARLSRKQGVWTLHTGQPISARASDGLIQQLRGERDAANLNAGRAAVLKLQGTERD